MHRAHNLIRFLEIMCAVGEVLKQTLSYLKLPKINYETVSVIPKVLMTLTF